MVRETGGRSADAIVPFGTVSAGRPGAASRTVIDQGRRYVSIALSCFYCGHSCSDVRVVGSSRPTGRMLRAAYAEVAADLAPTWDDHGQPRCPRCRAKLFMEPVETRRTYANP